MEKCCEGCGRVMPYSTTAKKTYCRNCQAFAKADNAIDSLFAEFERQELEDENGNR